MVDRVKYFVLGLLFLVVAGVIAFDRWNSPQETSKVADRGDEDDGSFELVVGDERERESIVGKTPPGPEGRIPSKPDPDEAALQKERERLARLRAEADEARRKERARLDEERRRLDEERKKSKNAPERVHIVRPGESLEVIALRYYKSRRGVDWIVKANGLANPNRIFEKQKLVIPAMKTAGKTPVVIKTPPKNKIPSTYVVKSSDGDLYAICRRFYGSQGEGARVARIMELNQLWSADVASGTTLRLPAK